MRRFFIFLLLAFLFALPDGLSAQGLPTLKKAPEITTGKLPNGVSYYLVTNPNNKGYADFALVQKGRRDIDAARAALVHLPHFTTPKPFEFLASKGIGYRRQGYVSYPKGATVFRFEDVPIFDSAASDSTLLLMFDLMGTCPDEQALVISGDIALKSLTERMSVFSLSITPRSRTASIPDYIWDPAGRLRFVYAQNASKRAASISVTYSSPRTPRAQMNTPQPLVTRIFATELGYILRKRTEQAFLNAGIPLSSTRYHYFDSAETPSDERYHFTAFTDRDCLSEATVTLARVLSALDTHGATVEEFQDAKDRFMSESRKTAGRRDMTNREYVQQCISAYLYGSNLAPVSANYEFFLGRKISMERELELFNRFVAALLDPQRALTLRYDTPADSLPRQRLISAFDSTWRAVAAASPDSSYRISYGDTLSLGRIRPKGVRLKVSTDEPITKGKMWTFSNGIKVIYKNMGNRGEFSYALMLKGGYSSVPGLGQGESAFVGDMLALNEVAGMPPMDFRNMLEANGITMDCKVSLPDMRITGSAPREKLRLLLLSLLAVAGERKPDRAAFERYRIEEGLRQERVRLSQQGINAVMDSIMCPSYFYPETKTLAFLQPDLQERAEQYFAAQFAKVNDGVLVIVGDVDETMLQKTLCRLLGGFSTGNRFSVRPKVPYRLRTGWSTYTIDAERSLVGSGETCVSVAMSALKPFDMNAYIACRIARVALKKEIMRELAGSGLYAEVKGRIRIFPAEEISVFINCRPCAPDGLPEGILPADPLTALGAVRAALNRVCSTPVTETDLKGYKAALSNEMASELARPERLIETVLVRNAEGKDLVSRYQEHIKAVTAKDVTEVLRTLDRGSKVEYIIK